ncbi:hypothetical protein BJ973_000416 [Actinoplanes tereljensis]|uniref:Uncharacterized protein n=1 Tax=Paractinoplanes tereljensis TaxID=571912 RepID=A0A919NRA1_9ACTN|nr:hypothetical protein [Actinoplanes tereljensis]GIF23228.1 hypothetical protein Ate02nite_59580 [Actinoplanes tereljensis]
MAARDRLTTFHQRGNAAQLSGTDFDRLMLDYFTLLWCFERIEAGRYLLAGRWRKSGPQRYLDRLIRWHVLEWEQSLNKVRRLLEARLDAPLDDRDSRQALARLHRVFLGGRWHMLT